ncbi:MAG: pyroglutamyl-peptidase I, partial [Oscillospiraceae bacterium]|nr:pyroglutamyl-peptidase I [Oscillospiraceae bacterium]
MKVLLTAFDPFGGEPVNPAQEAVAAVADNIAGAEIVKVVVPT